MRLSQINEGEIYALSPTGCHDGALPARDAVKVQVMRIDRERGRAHRTRAVIEVRVVQSQDGDSTWAQIPGDPPDDWVRVGGTVWVPASWISCTWTDAEALERINEAVVRAVASRRAAVWSRLGDLRRKLHGHLSWPALSTHDYAKLTIRRCPAARAARVLAQIPDAVMKSVSVPELDSPDTRARLLARYVEGWEPAAFSLHMSHEDLLTASEMVDRLGERLDQEAERERDALRRALPSILADAEALHVAAGARAPDVGEMLASLRSTTPVNMYIHVGLARLERLAGLDETTC